MSTQATESLIRDFHTVWGSSKFAESTRFTAPGATWVVSGSKESNPTAGSYTIEERIKQLEGMPKWAMDWEKFEVKILKLVVDQKGENAAVEVEVQIKEDGYRNELVQFVEVKGGKIQKIKEWVDYAPIAKYMKDKAGKVGKV